MINNLSGNAAERIKQSETGVLKATNSGNYTDLVMRFDQQPTSRPAFREAMKSLFDREQIKRVALRGYGEIANDQPIAPGTPYYFDGLPQREYDPERAASLLKKAGVAGATVPLVASPAANYSEDMAVLLQQSAAAAGLKLNINRVPADGYWSNHWMKHPWVSATSIHARPPTSCSPSSSCRAPRGTSRDGKTRTSINWSSPRGVSPTKPSASRCMPTCRP